MHGFPPRRSWTAARCCKRRQRGRLVRPLAWSTCSSTPGTAGPRPATDGVVRFICGFPGGPVGPERQDRTPFPVGRRPSDEEVYAAWPGEARIIMLKADTAWVTSFQQYGRLQDCNVSRNLKDLGFGEALRLKDGFSSLPGTKDTMSVSMRMTIRNRQLQPPGTAPFKLPDDFVGKHGRLVGGALEVRSRGRLSQSHQPDHQSAGISVLPAADQQGKPVGARSCLKSRETLGVEHAALSLVPVQGHLVPKVSTARGANQSSTRKIARC